MSREIRGVPLRALLIDWAGTVVVLLVVWWEYANPGLDDGARPPHPDLPVSIAFSIVAVLPLAVRRFAPVAALVATALALAVPAQLVVTWTLFYGGFVPAVFLLYTVARYRGLRAALAGTAVLVVAETWSSVFRQPQQALANTVFLLTFAALVIALGLALRRSAAQRTRLAELLDRVEAEQADRERLAVLDERTALARDLHDVVAHAVALMLVQAGAARVAVQDDPVLARQFLLGVERAGRDATGDLHHLLGVLRADDGSAALERPPGLSAVGELVDRMRAAGLDIELTSTGAAPALPDGFDVAAYRIVQEALTNVLKHAGPTRVRVELDARDPLRIRIRDDGPVGPPPAGLRSGHGLVGMRERAALFGGRVTAAPAGRGFEVRAVLPLPEPV